MHKQKVLTVVRSAKLAIKNAKWKKLTLLFIVFFLSTTIFVQLADEIVEDEPIGFDVPILEFANSFNSPTLDPYVVALTELGGAPLTIAVVVLGLLYLLRRNRQRAAVFLAVSIGGAALINYVFKLLFARSRPDLWEAIVSEATYSFPSGHAMASSAVAFSLMVLFWRSKWRWWVVAVGSIYFLTISFTRLYLGVHFPSDLLAGWCMSAAWIASVAIVVNGKSFWQKPQSSRRLGEEKAKHAS